MSSLSTEVTIILALTCVILLALGALWSVVNMRGVNYRGRRRHPKDPKNDRKSDTRRLVGPEKRLYKEAQKLLAQGRVAPAARVFEQLNMQREAIQVLEDAGMVHDAAKILMRMQRHNRAGVVYARHDMWQEAAGCFKIAGMYAEVGKCARLAGDYAQAAEAFEKASRPEEAAGCWEKLGDPAKAARLYAAAGNHDREIQAWAKAAGAVSNLATLELERAEMNRIVDWLGGGHIDEALARLVAQQRRLAEVVLQQIARGYVKQAATVIGYSPSDLGPQLMAEVNYQNRSAANLAEMFLMIDQPKYAGMIFERMSTFDRAGEAFDRAEEYERAAYCYERAGFASKAAASKDRAGKRPKSQRAAVPAGRQGGPFSLDTVNDSESQAAGGGPSGTASPKPPSSGAFDGPETALGSNEATAVLQTAAQDTRASAASGATASGARDGDTQRSPAADDTTPPAIKVAVPPPPRPRNHDQAAGEPPQPTRSSGPGIPIAIGGKSTLDAERRAFHAARFFADLDAEQREKLWAIGSTLAFGPDQNLMTYNDEPRGIYVITHGTVNCYKLVSGKEQYVDEMHESESFGEFWLLADQPTSVRFVAATEAKVRVIARDAFNDLLDKDGTIARKLYKRFTMRLLKRLIKPQNNGKNQAAS